MVYTANTQFLWSVMRKFFHIDAHHLISSIINMLYGIRDNIAFAFGIIETAGTNLCITPGESLY